MAGNEAGLADPGPNVPLDEAVFSFLDELRSVGFDIGVDEYLEAQDIILALADDDGAVEPVRLRNWMAAVFCGREEEQREFYRRFDRWWARAAPAARVARRGVAVGPTEPASRPVVEERVEQVIGQTGRGRWIAAAMVTIAAMMGGSLIYERMRHPPEPTLEVVITAPGDTTVAAGSRVTFSGSATGPDGDLTGSITWSSDQGDLGTGASVSDTFAVGTHVITATVASTRGEAVADSITLVVEADRRLAVVDTPGGEPDNPTVDTTGAGSYTEADQPSDARAVPAAASISFAPPATSRASISVTATVLGDDGSPLPGARVLVGGDAAEIGVGWTDVVAVSTGAGTAVTGHADGTVRVWSSDGALGLEIPPPDGGPWSILGLRGRPDGGPLAVLRGDRGLAVSEPLLGDSPRFVPEMTDPVGVTVSSSGDRVAVLRATGAIELLGPFDWARDGRGVARTDSSFPTAALFSPDDTRLLTYGFTRPGPSGEAMEGAHVWDVVADSIVTRFPADAPVTAAAWSTDGRLVALAQQGHDKVLIWDASGAGAYPDGPVPVDTVWVADSVEVTSLAFVEEDRLLAMGDASGRVSFHRPDRPYSSHVAHASPVRDLLPVGDRFLATRADAGPARFWDVGGLLGFAAPVAEPAPEERGGAGAGRSLPPPGDSTDASGRIALDVPIERFERGVVRFEVAHADYDAPSLLVELAGLDSAGVPRGRPGTLELQARMAPLGPWGVTGLLREHVVQAGLLAFAVPLILVLAWAGWRRSRQEKVKELIAERRSVPGRYAETGLGLARPATDLYRSPAFAKARIDARRYRVGGRGDLDAEATLDAVVRQAGPVEPIFRRRLQLPAYLALVDRVSVRDQAAAAADEFLNWLAQGGVPIVRYYYDGDPRMCAPAGTGQSYRSLRELASRYGDLRLLVFGDGSGLLNPVTGRLAGWTDRLGSWSERALMTPVAVEEWSTREAEAARAGFQVVPGTPAGLRAFVDTLRGLGGAPAPEEGWRPPYPRALSARPARWLDRNPPEPEELEALRDQLRAYLGADGYRWLCSLAIYPEQNWYLTLQLGMGLRTQHGAPVLTEARLLRLTRLPWLRHGRMPDWLREALTEDLSAEDEELIRGALQELLASAAIGGDAVGQLHLARPAEDRPKRGWRRLVTDVLRNEPEDSTLHDYVFVSFLHNRKPGRLQVQAPKAWHRWVYEQGLPGLGPRSVVVVAGVVLLSGTAALTAQGFVSGPESVLEEYWTPQGTTSADEPPNQNRRAPGRLILDFSARPDVIQQGDLTTLTWSTRNARVRIEPDIGRVGATGRRSLSPAASVTYRLVAEGPGGSTEVREAAVTVSPPSSSRVETPREQAVLLDSAVTTGRPPSDSVATPRGQSYGRTLVANIVGACSPSQGPSVQPARVTMGRADHVEWRETSGRANSWTITPKEPSNWPFASRIQGDPKAPAATGTPPTSAPAGVPFAYNVTVVCQDGSSQVIDPEIIIVES